MGAAESDQHESHNQQNGAEYDQKFAQISHCLILDFFRSQESGVRSQESGVRSQESGVRSRESGVRSHHGRVLLNRSARIARMEWRLLLLLALASVAGAQPSGEVPITSEPHHHQVLQNKYVRVFKVEVKSQQAMLMHRHEYDYAYVTLGATELINQVEGKPPADLKLQNGETRFSPGPFAHLIRVVAPAPFRNVTIEFLRGHQQSSSAKWAEDRGLQVLEGGTQDILMVKDEVRISDVSLKPGATLPRDRQASAQLLVSITDFVLNISIHSPAFHMRPGDVKWFDASQRLNNFGPSNLPDNLKRQARFILFEFH
jgi:hypothetical protein